MDNLSFAVGFTVGIGVTLIIAGFHKDWDHTIDKPADFKMLKDESDTTQESIDRGLRGDE